MPGVRLLLEADVPILLARVLRPRGHDVQHAYECGLGEADDEPVFAAGVSVGRAVMTYNVVDYAPLARAYGRAGKHHYGLVFSKQIDFRDLLARTLRFLAVRTPEDLRDATVWL